MATEASEDIPVRLIHTLWTYLAPLGHNAKCDYMPAFCLVGLLFGSHN